jgi:phosphoserine/homoserine phosphotransferase
MKLVCLDLEGVLIPEMWVAFAEKTGIDALKRTTRDEPDYDKLMQYRLDVLRDHDYGLPDIQAVVNELAPLPAAADFLDWLRSRVRVIILSDTFEEFAGPLMAQLNFPTLFCHNLEIGENGRITGYRLRQPDQKRKAVNAFRDLNFEVYAAGDSYNDLTMLQSAHAGILFRPPESMREEYPEFPVAEDHLELREKLETLL